MKKEDAVQLTRCVKECWWRVGVLLVILLGFALIAIHGWPQGDWGFGWGAIGATASVVIGGLALQISKVQKKWQEDKRNMDWHRLRSQVSDCLSLIHLYWKKVENESNADDLLLFYVLQMNYERFLDLRKILEMDGVSHLKIETVENIQSLLNSIEFLKKYSNVNEEIFKGVPNGDFVYESVSKLTKDLEAIFSQKIKALFCDFSEILKES